MVVESKNNNIVHKPNADKKGYGLTSRMDVAPKELAGIGKVLAQRRLMRDTTNHPDVELSKTGRQSAAKRRLTKASPNKTKASAIASDSGSPDDAGLGGDDSGADSGASA